MPTHDIIDNRRGAVGRRNRFNDFPPTPDEPLKGFSGGRAAAAKISSVCNQTKPVKLEVL
jgi:hypothetical protein